MDTKQARIQRGWTQEHLARAAGVDVRTIRRHEAGSGVSAETLLAIRAALGCFVEEPEHVDEGPRGAPTRPRRMLSALARFRDRRLANPGKSVSAMLVVGVIFFAGYAIGNGLANRVVPYSSSVDVLTFTTEAMSRALTISFARDWPTYPDDPRFTEAGWDSLKYTGSLEGILGDVREQRAVVSAVPRTVPVRYGTTFDDGAPVYIVRAEMLITFSTATTDSWSKTLEFMVFVSEKGGSLRVDRVVGV